MTCRVKLLFLKLFLNKEWGTDPKKSSLTPGTKLATPLPTMNSPAPTSVAKRTRILIPLIVLTLLGSGVAFHFHQNAGALGGSISWAKTLWLFFAVGLWFFISPVLALDPALPLSLRKTLGSFSTWMWLRGVAEIYMLGVTKNWIPPYGIVHDLSAIALLLGFFWGYRKDWKEFLRSDHAQCERTVLAFIALIFLSLWVEILYASLFYFAVAGATTGRDGLWFAVEGQERFRIILIVTKTLNLPIVSAAMLLLAQLVWPKPLGSMISKLKAIWSSSQKQDPRYWIAAAQFSYILLGFTVLGFNRTPIQVAITVLSTMTFELLLHRIFRGQWIFPLSAMITSFGLSLLVNYAHNYYLLLIPVFFAIGSKYIFTFKDRHYLNPAMSGVYFSLLFGGGLISSSPAYQWRGIESMAAFIAMFGILFLLPKINRTWLVLSFFLTFTAQTALRALIMKHHLPFETLFFGTISTPAFFLFLFFMITDPATSPSSKRSQIAFGVALGLLDLALHIKQSYGTFFKSLFWLSIARLAWAHLKHMVDTRDPWGHFKGAFLGNRYFLRPVTLSALVVLSLGTYRTWISPALALQNLDWSFQKVSATDSGIQSQLGDALTRIDPRVQHMGKWLLSVGDSVATADYDGDGDPDLFLTNTLKQDSDRNALYRNDGNFKFTRVSIPAIEKRSREIEKYGLPTNAIFVDIDNDADKDLFLVYAFGHSVLLRNELKEQGQAKFTDITQESGLDFPTNSIAANFADFNRDGRLDLIIGNVWPKYLPDYPTPTPLNLFQLPQPEFEGDVRMFNFMHESWNMAANGGELELFFQDSNGRFIKQDSKKIGFLETRWTLAIATGDLNQDGWTDLYIANDFGPDQLLLNDGAGSHFTEIEGPFFGTISRDTYKGMNATIADFDRNGWQDIYISNVHHVLQAEGSLLWMLDQPKNTGNPFVPIIEDRATELGALNENRFGWGATASDVNNDGWLDIIQANGMVDDTIDKRFEKCPDFWYTNERIALSPPHIHRYIHNWGDIRGRCIYGQELNRVYLNGGSRKGQMFQDVASQVGITDAGNTRGISAADFNNDGRLDLVMSHPFKDASLFANQSKLRTDNPSLASSGWIKIKLEGDGIHCNRDAVGSQVKIGPQIREVQTLNGFAAQSDPVLHFGLGANLEQEVSVRVKWCGQSEIEYSGLRANQLNVIRMETQGLAQNVDLPSGARR